jgi:biopolymer transport protein ExbD
MAGAVGVGKGPRSDINITPLVDVVLVLLIIFMVLTPMLEKELGVRVPEDVENTPPPQPDDPQPMVLRVEADGKVLVNGLAIAKGEEGKAKLHEYYLIAKQLEASNPKAGPPIMFFEADDKAKYGDAIAALDLVRLSSPGWIIGMMTEKLAPQPAEGQPGGDQAAPPAPAPQ